MPGLVGIVNLGEDERRLASCADKMIKLLLHEKYYHVKKVVNRGIALSSLDLHKGDFLSTVIETDHYVLGVTGQIYDQKKLLGKISNHHKQTNDLPNLLLELFKKSGPEALCGLNGIYVVVIWNKKARMLHIINDRHGFKKLYYWISGVKFVFASEYKAISWMPDFPRKIDVYAFANLMTFGYVLGNRTLFKHINILPAASNVTVQDSNLSIKKYWDYSFYENGDPTLSEDEYINAFADKISVAVNRRLRGVERLALPLSGGLDSRTMAATLRQFNIVRYVKAYSQGHRHCYDVRFGKKIAKKLGYPHETLAIAPDFIKKNARTFLYLAEGSAACDWACRIDARQKRLFTENDIDTVLSGFLGDVLCRFYMSWKAVMRRDAGNYVPMTDHDNAVMKIFRRNLESFDDQFSKRYFSPNIFQKVKGHNFEIIRQTYYNAPTDNVFNRARYVNLHQRQRRFTSTLLDHYEYFSSVISPFVDNEFMDFILHVPPEMQNREDLYKKMLIRHFPDVVGIGHSETGIPIKPNRWQAALQWRLERHRNTLKKLTFGLYGRHDYKEYRHTAHALRTASRQLMLKSFGNVELKKAFFNVDRFDRMVAEFLDSKSEKYEMVCYPLTFFLWADIFNASDF